ncbi:MAG TPA: Abi-alpha family protein [Verrucomicrobiae bacterium]|nr:Abi-alpha family protein [Verrucomicrobiae bacterium]
MLPKIPEGLANAVDTTTKTAKEFLEKIAGPPAEEFGLFLGDQVRLFRFRKQVKLLADAGEILKQAGINPKKVPLKTLFPILEGASLEEDESMSARWAALLATAANPKSTITVQPSFPEILKQLSPLEAKILDLIFDMINQIGIVRAEWPSRGALGKSVRDLLQLQEQDFEIAIDNLYRLRLCSPPSTKLDFIDNKEHRFQLSTKDLICITELGFSFVSACKISDGSKTNLQEKTSENTVKLARGAMGTDLKGEWSPEIMNHFNEMWLITIGANRGTYIYIHPTPTKGNPPWTGAPYWVQLPQGGNAWL